MTTLPSQLIWPILPATLAVVSLVITTVHPVQNQLPQTVDPPVAEAAHATASGTEAIPPAVLAEISEIRKRLGYNLWEDSGLESRGSQPDAMQAVVEQDNPSFDEALRNVAARSPVSAVQQPMRLQRVASASPVRTAASRQNTMNYVHSLRLSSRLLDSQAADLEDENRFQLADQLRELASQIRLEARRVLRVSELRTTESPRIQR